MNGSIQNKNYDLPAIDHLDIWASAWEKKASGGRGGNGKLSPYGIQKLRELILELAVRGRLVPQDPNDEPASVLLEKIAKEKARLVREGKIKKPKKLPEITEEEKPFELPEGWEWVKLGQLMEMFNGKAFKQSDWKSEGLPIVRIQNLNDPAAPFNHFDGDIEEKHKIDNGTFLISWSGTPGTSFGAFIWNRGSAVLNQHINKCVLFGDTNDPDYIRVAVNGCMDHLIQKAQGGVGLKHVTKSTLNNVVFGLPPLAEQHRIVAKVDELMFLCDRLEQEQTDSLDAHQILVETLLRVLVDTPNAEAAQQAWHRIAQHFERLFTTEAAIDQLKQTILQLAVMGRLVPFGSNVRTEAVKELLSFGPRNGFSPKEVSYETSIKVLKLGATSYGMLDLTQSKFVDEEVPSDSHLWLREGDILIQRGNSACFVGSNVLVEENCDGVIYPDLMMKVRVNDLIEPTFLSLLLKAPSSREFMWSRMTGTSGTMPKISKKVVQSLRLRFPVEKEIQKMVVDKVGQLMALCEALKARIQEAETTQLHLADAVVEQAVG